jgi:hypothetical protein
VVIPWNTRKYNTIVLSLMEPLDDWNKRDNIFVDGYVIDENVFYTLDICKFLLIGGVFHMIFSNIPM